MIEALSKMVFSLSVLNRTAAAIVIRMKYGRLHPYVIYGAAQLRELPLYSREELEKRSVGVPSLQTQTISLK
jgi:hypothetical protein